VIELALPGEMPRSPLRTLEPVLVTAEAARTAKLVSAPSGGAVAASGRADTSNDRPASESDKARIIEIDRSFNLCIFFVLPL
jgi:hypothetical protein